MAVDLLQELLLICSALRADGVEFAVCGGLALAIHGLPRATVDIDILIREEQAGTAERAVAVHGYTLGSGIIPFDTGKPTERRIIRISRAIGEDLVTLDLLLVTAVLEEVWSSRQAAEVSGQVITVVSKAGLIRMKQFAGRPIDLADIMRLEGGRE